MLDPKKPIMIMFAGPNGSGKSTTVKGILKENLIVFINPDDIGRRITYSAQTDETLKKDLIDLGKAFNSKTMNKLVQSALAKKFYESDQGKSIVEPITEEYIKANPIKTVFYEHLQKDLDLKATTLTDDHYLLTGINLVGAQVADELKDLYIQNKTSFAVAEYGGFAFETVMSSPKSIDHLKLARENGLATHTFYVTTNDPQINVVRVQKRVVEQGGHGIDSDTIISRHAKSLQLLPEAVLNSDSSKIIDTTDFESIREISFKVEQSLLDKMNKLKTFLQNGTFPQEAIEAVSNKITQITPAVTQSQVILSSPLSECGKEVGIVVTEVIGKKTTLDNGLGQGGK